MQRDNNVMAINLQNMSFKSPAIIENKKGTTPKT